MKIVAVSQRVDHVPNRSETRDSLDQRLTAFLIGAGYLPLPVPNRLKTNLSEWLEINKISRVLLSGGNNIGEYPERDETELMLIDYCALRGIPLVGICRGMQIMAGWAGVALHRVDGHENSSHDIFGDIEGKVLSYHSYAINNCPSTFKVLARSADGEIEAIRHSTLAWEGWMWHPEREDYAGFSKGQERLSGVFL